MFIIQFGVIDPTRAAATLLLILAVFAILIILAVRAQGALINGTLTRKKVSTTKLMRMETWVFIRIFLVDAAARIMVAALLAFSTVPLGLFGTELVSNTIASLVVLLLFIAIMIAISMLSILAVVSAAYGKNDLYDSLHEALVLLKKNPLYLIEVAVLLFLIQILGFMVMMLALLVLWIPYLLAYLGAVLTTATALTVVVSLVSALIAFMVVLVGTWIFNRLSIYCLGHGVSEVKGRKLIPKFHRFAKTFRIL